MRAVEVVFESVGVYEMDFLFLYFFCCLSHLERKGEMGVWEKETYKGADSVLVKWVPAYTHNHRPYAAPFLPLPVTLGRRINSPALRIDIHASKPKIYPALHLVTESCLCGDIGGRDPELCSEGMYCQSV